MDRSISIGHNLLTIPQNYTKLGKNIGIRRLIMCAKFVIFGNKLVNCNACRASHKNSCTQLRGGSQVQKLITLELFGRIWSNFAEMLLINDYLCVQNFVIIWLKLQVMQAKARGVPFFGTPCIVYASLKSTN